MAMIDPVHQSTPAFRKSNEKVNHEPFFHRPGPLTATNRQRKQSERNRKPEEDELFCGAEEAGSCGFVFEALGI
jgi:hypothetical protein